VWKGIEELKKMKWSELVSVERNRVESRTSPNSYRERGRVSVERNRVESAVYMRLACRGLINVSVERNRVESDKQVFCYCRTNRFP